MTTTQTLTHLHTYTTAHLHTCTLASTTTTYTPAHLRRHVMGVDKGFDGLLKSVKAFLQFLLVVVDAEEVD